MKHNNQKQPNKSKAYWKHSDKRSGKMDTQLHYNKPKPQQKLDKIDIKRGGNWSGSL